MTFLYYVLICIVHIISLPFLCLLSFKQKYNRSIPFRFIFPLNHSKEHYDIWLHACSVGEVKSLQKLIESIPLDKSLFISVITQTGFNQAKKLYSNRLNTTIQYLPFETFIPFVSPSCNKLFVFEAELWLMLFVHAKNKGAVTKLINARISTRSFKRYLRFKFFYKHILKYIDFVLSQSDNDSNRLKILGANNVETLGNIKITNKIQVNKNYDKPKRLIIVAASTHEGEEDIILKSFKKVNQLWNMSNNKDSMQCKYECNQWINNKYNSKRIEKDNSNVLFVIVPRHPERFDEVYDICNKYFTTIRFSSFKSKSKIKLDNIKEKILLVDSMGELINFYAISDIVILGGAFAMLGGHNPLEVAHFDNVLISGTNIFNQKALFSYVYNYYLINQDDLYKIIISYKELYLSAINEEFSNNIIEKILN